MDCKLLLQLFCGGEDCVPVYSTFCLKDDLQIAFSVGDVGELLPCGNMKIIDRKKQVMNFPSLLRHYSECTHRPQA